MAMWTQDACEGGHTEPDESLIDSCRRIERHVREAREKGRIWDPRGWSSSDGDVGGPWEGAREEPSYDSQGWSLKDDWGGAFMEETSQQRQELGEDSSHVLMWI